MKNEIWELIGIIIGDGNLWTDWKGSFRIEVTGDLKKDRAFFLNRVKPLFSKFTKNKIVIRERSNGLRLRVVDKNLFMQLMKLGLKPHLEKLKNLGFLNTLSLNKRRLVLRGLMDTDGSVVLRSNKQVFLEISTKSEFLVNWIKESLEQLGFRVFTTRARNKLGGNLIFRVVTSGKENVDNWINLIGFSNIVKFNRAIEILSGTDKGTVAQPGQLG